MAHVELIYSNSVRYNGPESTSDFTKAALSIVTTARDLVEQNADQIQEWEEGIKAKQV